MDGVVGGGTIYEAPGVFIRAQELGGEVREEIVTISKVRVGVLIVSEATMLNQIHGKYRIFVERQRGLIIAFSEKLMIHVRAVFLQ